MGCTSTVEGKTKEVNEERKAGRDFSSLIEN